MPPSSADNFLPGFCRLRPLIVLILVCEMLALALTLFAEPGTAFWQTLALSSFFILWVAILSAAVLCLFHRLLARLSDAAAGATALGLVLLVTALLSLLVFASGLPLETRLSATTFTLRNTAIAALAGIAALHYLYLAHRWRLESRAQAEAQIQALQARIRPHFLFNSMNTIASLARRDPALTEKLVLDLADLFRASMADTGTAITLDEELAFCRQYLDIEKLRLGERLTIHWQLPQPLPALRMPPLTLQPLLENAVYHGIEPAESGGEVSLRLTPAEDQVVIEIENSFSPQHGSHRDGNHLAWQNICQRLHSFYAGRAALSAAPHDASYRVTLRLPL